MTEALAELYTVIAGRKVNPPLDSYTASLFSSGLTEIVKKVGEEAVEVLVAATSESETRVVYESADLIYHLLVLLAARGIEWQAVEQELARRRGTKS
jgi:phosphoribosyl-ATP pyrophosphohydrolase